VLFLLETVLLKPKTVKSAYFARCLRQFAQKTVDTKQTHGKSWQIAKNRKKRLDKQNILCYHM